MFKVTSRPDGNAKGNWRAYDFNIIGRYPEGVTKEQVAAAHNALRALPKLGPPDTAPDVLPTHGPRPRLEGGATRNITGCEIEMTSSGPPPANDDKPTDAGVGMWPFASLDDDIPF
jgi:hypothetical protein